MSTTHRHPSPAPQQSTTSPRSYDPVDSSLQTAQPSSNESGRIIFLRQLWQRNMPDADQSEHGALNKSQVVNSQASQNNASRRTSSTISLRSHRRSPGPGGASKTPLTPEESPPFRSTRKRSAAFVEQEDRATDAAETSPAHTRTSSGESALHVCICQPSPKIPRPRNAFILYRQHHQANVVARNPGLANPEISKIIGQQWQDEAIEQKNKWKALAEEEKLRHQQQYPAYRYQPRRNGRGNSTDGGSVGDKPNCQKCGGRTILTPSAPYSAGLDRSLPTTPGSAITSLARTLPVFRDLSLESPAGRRARGSYPPNNIMSPNHRNYSEDRDDLGPLSPDSKRRKYNPEQPPQLHRAMPPRYGGAPPGVVLIGPGTPFPFSQTPTHAYSPTAVQLRRESLPGIRGVVSPQVPMGPPPRPSIGYQQHRLSQGHLVQDRSLTLPPLQTVHSNAPAAVAGSGKTVDEQIMNISFRYKIKVLSQVAPPAPREKDAPRGPLIAVEGDSYEAVQDLAAWLKEVLSKDEDLEVKLFDGPEVSAAGGKEEAMAQYHRLAADWLGKNTTILESIAMKPQTDKSGDASMADSTPPQSSTKIHENYDDSDDASPPVGEEEETRQDSHHNRHRSNSSTEKMDVDKSKRSSTVSTSPTTKPVTIIPNYSLHTSNFFARVIPIGPNDPYALNDHWQWTATLWRGIIGPDLTIYLRDATAGTTGPIVEMEGVEGRPDVGMFVVKRVRGEGGDGADGPEIDASVLRRVGFEVSEWVRAFGSA